MNAGNFNDGKRLKTVDILKYMFEQAGQFSKDLIRIRDNTKLEIILMLVLGSD